MKRYWLALLLVLALGLTALIAFAAAGWVVIAFLTWPAAR